MITVDDVEEQLLLALLDATDPAERRAAAEAYHAYCLSQGEE